MRWRSPSRVTVFIVLLTGVFVAMVIFAASGLILNTRDDNLSSSESQTVRFTNGASMALNRNLLGVDILLASLNEALNLSESMVDWIDLPTASESMTRYAQQNMLLRNLSLLDDQGQVLATSDPAGKALQLNLPASFLNEVIAQSVSTLVISAPSVSFSSAEPVLYLARYILLANTTRVIAVAEVPINLLTALLVQGVDIPGLEVSLERTSGELLISLPIQTDTALPRRALPLAAPAPDEKPVLAAARLSGQPAIVVTRPVLYRGIVVAASLPIEAILDSWRPQRNFILSAALGFVLMILTASTVAINYLARMAETRRNLALSKAKVEQLAFFDPLTGLSNRRMLMDRLQHAVQASARSGQRGALLFLDLDRFKTLNDTLGHDVGDELLIQVAQRLSATVRAQDTVARLGGDEFVVMLTDLTADPHHAVSVAQNVGHKVLASLNAPYLLAGRQHVSTPSIGAALFGGDAQSPADILKQADIAMYQVKASGRNAFCFFDPQMQANITARANLERDLWVALTEHQFQLYYQSQHQLGGPVVGAEVLIRWHHPQRGMVSPGEFIPVAEDSELILPIGHWVLRTACQQLAAWRDNPLFQHLLLSVNVSARQFLQPSFVAEVAAVIQETGIAPASLKLELTESLVLENVESTILKMTELKALGVQFSVDDFGTGHSSLAYLTRLPLNQLKIDQSFVRNIGIQATDGVIVQTIIGMARNLGLEVIAEGVETQAQQEFLALHGCTMFQGYFFSKPIPLAAFEAMLSNTLSILQTKLTPTAALLLTIPPLMWAGNAVVGRLVSDMVSPMTLNLLRWVLAFLLLLPVAGGVLRPSSGLWPHWRRFAMLGLLSVGAYNALLYLALNTSTPINVTLVGASTPVWMLLIGRLFFNAPISPRQGVGAVLSITGVLLVLSRGQWEVLKAVQWVPGDLYVLMASAAWATYSWMLARPTTEPQAIRSNGTAFLLAQMAFGMVWSALFSGGEWALGKGHFQWSWPLAAALVFIAVGPAVIAYRAWGAGVGRAGPAAAGFFINLTPLFTAVLSTVFLGEVPQIYHALAFVLIVGGIIVSSRR